MDEKEECALCKIERLENVLADIAELVQDDFVSGNDIMTVLKKHGIVKK